MSRHEPIPAYRSAYDIKEARLRRIAEANQYLAEIDEDRNMEAIYEPYPVPPACRTPIRPGSHCAAAAFKDGAEDDYINKMKARYGGEW